MPSVSVVQREYSIVEGSPLSISCQVDANPPPNLVNWRLVSDGEYPAREIWSNPAKSGVIWRNPEESGEIWRNLDPDTDPNKQAP